MTPGAGRGGGGLAEGLHCIQPFLWGSGAWRGEGLGPWMPHIRCSTWGAGVRRQSPPTPPPASLPLPSQAGVQGPGVPGLVHHGGPPRPVGHPRPQAGEPPRSPRDGPRPLGATCLAADSSSLPQVCEIIESPLFLKLNPMTKHTDVSPVPLPLCATCCLSDGGRPGGGPLSEPGSLFSSSPAAGQCL